MADPKLIRIVCPNLLCMRIIAVAEGARGKLVRCRRCGTTVRIPRPAEPKLSATSTSS